VVKKIIVIIQARIFSQRLKGKILFSFFNESVLDRIVRIVKSTNFNKEIVILSGNLKKNSLLSYYSKKHKIRIFFESEINLLKRFQKYIKINNYENYYILRITSDNYLIQPNILNQIVKLGVSGNYDYAYIRPLSHYAGELIKAKVLLNEKNQDDKIKNHVTMGIRNNKNLKILALQPNFFGINHKKYFTLDTVFDLLKMKKLEFIYPELKKLDCIKCIKKIQRENWKF
jgi:spore coat polysaccharide biosynthesis protein SpsF (cytidylyltransferase family)